MRRRSRSSILPIPKVQCLGRGWPRPKLLILTKIQSTEPLILIKVRSIKLLILIKTRSIKLLIPIILCSSWRWQHCSIELLIVIKSCWWRHCSIRLLIVKKRLTRLRRRQLSISLLIRMKTRRWFPRSERSKIWGRAEISIGFTNRMEVRVSSCNVLLTLFAGRTVGKVSPAAAPATSEL